MSRDVCGAPSGFSLVETLVAIAVLLVALASISQLFAVAAAASQRASRRTLATLAGRQKLEELRSASATTLTVSPAGALEASLEGYSDVFDAGGARGSFGVPTLVRRWSVDPLPADPARLVIVQVTVLGLDGRVEARFVTMRRKQGT